MLRKDYKISDMAYLDSDAAAPIYAKKADIIKQHGLTGVVDIGCRTGTVNQYLLDYHYSYYGFDTSVEPIEHARSIYKNALFEVRSWHNPLMPPFSVDVLIFGSVIIYEPDPFEFFEKMVEFYKPVRCIVHEVNDKNVDELKYTDLTYFTNNYRCEVYELDLPIPCGKRTIIDVEC
jgi:trans-aconitate methyltransferase